MLEVTCKRKNFTRFIRRRFVSEICLPSKFQHREHSAVLPYQRSTKCDSGDDNYLIFQDNRRGVNLDCSLKNRSYPDFC